MINCQFFIYINIQNIIFFWFD